MDELRFSQREGEAPLPQFLPLKVLSKELRNALWNLVYEKLRITRPGFKLNNNWEAILKDYHTDIRNLPGNEFRLRHYREILKKLIYKNPYNEVLDFLEHVLNHPNSPADFDKDISETLEKYHAAYIVIQDDSKFHFFQRGHDEEHRAWLRNLSDLHRDTFEQVYHHFKASEKYLLNDKAQNSIVESIAALMNLLTVLSEKNSQALEVVHKECDKKWFLHPILKRIKAEAATTDSIAQEVKEVFKNPDVADAQFFLSYSLALASCLVHKCDKQYRL